MLNLVPCAKGRHLIDSQYHTPRLIGFSVDLFPSDNGATLTQMLVFSSTVAVNISRFTAAHGARNGEVNNLENSNVAPQLLSEEGEWKGLRLVRERQIIDDRPNVTDIIRGAGQVGNLAD